MRWLDIIMESANQYEPMFNMFKDPNGQFPAWVTARIRSVQNLMKRKDRIIWALRWERYIAAYKTNDAALRQKVARDLGVSDNFREQANRYENMMRDDFPHWFSLNIPQMTNYVFDRQSPEKIMMDFMGIEEEWKKTRAQIINHADKYPEVADQDDDDEEDTSDSEWETEEERREREKKKALARKGNIEKIIDFGDGWAWWNLNRAYCKIEGDAMGHCGNGPSAKPGETVLSLRFDKGDGNFRPSLTFILDTNTGMLGETKGRANEKPAPKYHDMIVRLLMHPMIKGCEGGGYASDHNFTILDLPKEVREKLLAKKPALLSMHDRLQLYKEDPSEQNKFSLETEVAARIRKAGFRFKRIDLTMNQPTIVIREWESKEAFLSNYNNISALDKMNDFFESLEENLTEYCEPEEAQIYAGDAYRDYYNSLFDVLLRYPDNNFILDDVYLDRDGEKVSTKVSVSSFLRPRATDDDYNEDNEPVLDRIGTLDEEMGYGSYNDNDWEDIKSGFDDVDEYEFAILKFCFTENGKDEAAAIQDILTKYENGLSGNYHSDHPDQLSFEFPTSNN